MCIDMDEKCQCSIDYLLGYVVYEYEYIEQDILFKNRSDIYFVSMKMQMDDWFFKKSKNNLMNVEYLKIYVIIIVDMLI